MQKCRLETQIGEEGRVDSKRQEECQVELARKELGLFLVTRARRKMLSWESPGHGGQHEDSSRREKKWEVRVFF